MDGAAWLRVVDIFHAALECPEAEQAAFVAAACEGDPEIRSEVQAMLDEDRRGVSWLRKGMAEAVDQAFESRQGPPSFLPPDRIGPYDLQEFLGRGGMGAVWKAVRVDTGQPMAIKFLLPRDQLPEVWRDRFAGEINMLARLRHPYIVSFHDAGILDDGTPFFVMDYVEEYVRGMRFTAYCRVARRTVEERLRLFRSVCEAVLSAHFQTIIHRDLKPSNILVAKDGTPRIVDFGIARQLRDAGELADAANPSLVMSLDYAAPEWKHDGRVGLYTDVYSLGVMLYEVLAGRHPYREPAQAQGDGADERSHQLPEKPSAVRQPQPPQGHEPRLSRRAWRDLDDLCLKALHPDWQKRYHSVESLIGDIDHCLSNKPLDAHQPQTLRYLGGKYMLRHRRALLASAATLLLMVSMAAFFTWRLAKERNLAVTEAARLRSVQDFMNNLLQGGDQDAGPEANLPVTAMVDRGVQLAGSLRNAPLIQSDLYQTLGTISQKLGRLGQAESLLQKALQAQEPLKGQDREGIARTRIALALVYADEGKTASAERLVRQSLDEIRSRGPGNDASLGQAELALGTVMIAGGEHRQAVAVLEQAAKTIEAAEGPRSPALARGLGELGDAQIYLGNFDAADAFNRRALAIDRAVYGEDYPHVADDLGNLAEAQDTRGYYAQAETLEREALAIMEKWYGPDHPETARKLTTLASTLVYEKKNDEADKLLERALAIQERVYGPDHPRVAYVLNSIGAVALGEKRFSEAEKDDARVADIYRRAYGDGDYRVGVALDNLASVYQAEKRYGECENLLLDVIGRFTRAVGAGNINTGMARARLGMALLQDHKYRASVEQSLAGYRILSKQMNPDSGWIVGTRRDLAAAYAALDEPQQAEQFRAAPATAAARASR